VQPVLEFSYKLIISLSRKRFYLYSEPVLSLFRTGFISVWNRFVCSVLLAVTRGPGGDEGTRHHNLSEMDDTAVDAEGSPQHRPGKPIPHLKSFGGAGHEVLEGVGPDAAEHQGQGADTNH